MHAIETVLGLLLIVAALAWLASRIRVAYPILLVIGGLGLGFIPGLPRVEMKPEWVFVLFLPPLLYYAALQTTWRDFRNNLRPISLLAVGLVLFTTCLVAAAAYCFIPGFTWPAAFVLGAIISPPDAVAATAITQRLRVPKRIVTILEGESLVNDATALVAYRFAMAAVVAGTFSLASAAGRFVVVAAGGVIVGYLAGLLVAWVRPRIKDDSVESVVSILTPFVAYLPAEWLGVSGVLAAVTAGIYLSRRIPQIVSPAVRLHTVAVWDTIVFLLNGLIFILIGLQLPQVIGRLAGQSIVSLIGYAALISAVAIAVRMLWVFPATYLPRMLFRKLRDRDPAPAWQQVFVIAWTGMRGIVSLAAAMALPLTTNTGAPFGNRDLIIFITFGVILATLVLQGLSLPPLIRWLELPEDAEEEAEETTARYLSAVAAVERLDALVAAGGPAVAAVARVRAGYDERIQYFSRQLADPGNGSPADGDVGTRVCQTGEDAIREAITAERRMLVRLRDDGVIGDEVLRRVQQELDHEESRIAG